MYNHTLLHPLRQVRQHRRRNNAAIYCCCSYFLAGPKSATRRRTKRCCYYIILIYIKFNFTFHYTFNNIISRLVWYYFFSKMEVTQGIKTLVAIYRYKLPRGLGPAYTVYYGSRNHHHSHHHRIIISSLRMLLLLFFFSVLWNIYNIGGTTAVSLEVIKLYTSVEKMRVIQLIKSRQRDRLKSSSIKFYSILW